MSDVTLSARSGPRAVLGLGLSLLTLAVLHGVALPSAGTRPFSGGSGQRPDEVLVVVLAWAGMALAAWLALGSALGLCSALPGALGRWCARLADQLTPLLVRRVLTVVLGTSTVSLALPPAAVVGTAAGPLPVGLAVSRGPDGPTPPVRAVRNPAATEVGPGYATTGDVDPGYHPTPPSAASRQGDTSTDVTPGFRPTRPMPAHDGASSRLLAPPPRPEVAAHDAVTVRRGDTLWSIAARHLAAGASDAEVARAWPRWYAANRAVIGENPDLIRPGMRLVPPREGVRR